MRSTVSGFVATPEDFVAVLVLQDHFQAAPVVHIRCSHAWSVLLGGLDGSRPQVSPHQRIPLTATSGDNVVDEQQGSYPARFCRRTVMERTSRRKPHQQPSASKAWRCLLPKERCCWGCGLCERYGDSRCGITVDVYRFAAPPRRSVRTRRDGVRLWDEDGFAIEPLGFDPRALASSRKLRRKAGSDMAR